MADPSWKYPNTTAPTTTITFPRALFEKDAETLVGNNDVAESEYGEIFTNSRGPNFGVFVFTIQVSKSDAGGNVADKADIETFVGATVNFSQRPFYYTDRDSVEHKVKIMNKRIEWIKMVNYVEFTFTLREVE